MSERESEARQQRLRQEGRAPESFTVRTPAAPNWADYQAALVDEPGALTEAEVCERLLIAEMLKRAS